MRKLAILVTSLVIPVLVFAQGDTQKKKAYYFYGETCPHCKKVDEYFTANGIYDKYDITKLEFSNPFNARLLIKFGEAYNDPNKGGVPAVAFDDKFITGDQPIIDNFVTEIDASNNAYELPDPDKIASSKSNTNPKNEASQTNPGNKRNYFPVILITLVVIGAGALIYINRKKSNQ